MYQVLVGKFSNLRNSGRSSYVMYQVLVGKFNDAETTCLGDEVGMTSHSAPAGTKNVLLTSYRQCRRSRS